MESMGQVSEGPNHSNYVLKTQRISTFENFPGNCPVRPDELAEAGFFSAGRGDSVYCFYCAGGLNGWEPGDIAWEEHARHYPQCGFVGTLKGKRFVQQIQEKYKQLPQMDLTEKARHPDLVYETDRLRTYRGFPEHCPARPEVLVKAGLSYTGVGDSVVCFYCDLTLSTWVNGDDPWEDHAHYRPKCKFLHVMKGSQYVEQVLRKHDLPLPEHSFQPISSPLYPNYAFEADRLQTYQIGTFPARCPVRPKALVRAGLFFTGNRDCVCCFSCGGKLRSWEPRDDPWEEHIKHNPSCQFAQVMKGGKYVQEILQKHGLLSSGETLSPEGTTTSTSHSNAEEGSLEMVRLIDSLNRLERGPGQTVIVSTPAPSAAEVRPPAQQRLPNAAASADENTLQEENRMLKEEKVCKVCLDNEVTIAFFPCGHFCCCDECAMAIPNCPICREKITQRQKVFLT